MSAAVSRVRARLFELRDEDYRAFTCKLTPTLDPDAIIGARTPALRKLAREMKGTPDAEEFLRALPHAYYEENNLHGFLIETVRDFDDCLAELERFLPYVDNWATCDMTSPKALKKDLPRLRAAAERWMDSDRTYTVRFGIGMLMRCFLDAHFDVACLERVAAVRSEEYYVRMMVAWFFATALAKQYDAALPYIEGGRLEPWVHNKAIQKALESDRISDEHKNYLRKLKISGRILS